MALASTNLSIMDIHAATGGGTTTADTSLNDSDIRTWGNLYNVHSANPSFNVGTAGIPTTSGTEIAIGEFRLAAVPAAPTAFAGNVTHKYAVFPGGQYAPSSYQDLVSVFATPTFVGTLMGVTATHTITALYNSSLIASKGTINMTISNNAGATYSNSGWTSITVGSQTLNRTAGTFTTSTVSSTQANASYAWGSAGSNFSYATGFAFTTHFGAISNVISGVYQNTTSSFQLTI